ncbi:MAG: CheR family methyltransferase [Campylobacterota bacterium]|nr:CheR family methyltransferase [Campylobacterota bacterium]
MQLVSEKDFVKLTDLLYRRTGISIDIKRYSLLVKKLDTYLEKKNFKSFRDYFHEIRFNKGNINIFQDLINIVTINETYFYREKYHFEILVDKVLYELDELRPKDEVFRILHSPCSTGEEAFGTVLHLLEEGKIVEQRDIEIIGIDIDSTVIQKSKHGLFSKRSIDFLPKSVLEKYFTQESPVTYRLDPNICNSVNFKVVNVSDKGEMRQLGKFDVIFSRNMLIYFDDASKKDVCMTYYNMLKSKGFVFLGHAESMNRIVSVFNTRKYDNQIVYQKQI